MEIQIYNPTQGQQPAPVEWNYAEIKAWLESGLERYKGVIYDETQIAQAKADRASLNKLSQAIDAKRREVRQTYLQACAEFEEQAKELTGMVKEQAAEIDAQVKTYEAYRKEEKWAKIEEELYAPMIGNLAELVPYKKLHESKWCNVTCSMGTVADELAKKIQRIESGLEAIGKMEYPEDLKEAAKMAFLKDFDLSAAMAATERVAKQREALARLESAEAAQKAEGPKKVPVPEITRPEPKNGAEINRDGDSEKENLISVSFRVHVTRAQLAGLGEYMKANGIKPERI